MSLVSAMLLGHPFTLPQGKPRRHLMDSGLRISVARIQEGINLRNKLMKLFWEQECVTYGEAISYLSRDQSTVSRHIRKLEEDEMVRRIPNICPTGFEITEKGKEYVSGSLL